eukprot:scaffold303959_cov94-Attheya_sp.AAC.1
MKQTCQCGSSYMYSKYSPLLSQQHADPSAVHVLCLTQTPGPLCALALANHVLQGYSVNHALIRLLYDVYLRPVLLEDVWMRNKGSSYSQLSPLSIYY